MWGLLKNKRKHTVKYVGFYPHHNVGHWGYIKTFKKKGRIDKRSLTQRNGYIHTQDIS